MRHLRHLAADIRLTHARSAHTTDAVTIVVVAIGFLVTLGTRQLTWALLPGAGVYWFVPALTERLLTPRRRRSERPELATPRSAIKVLVVRTVVSHTAHTLGIAWLLGWSISIAGVLPVLRVLAAGALVYELPRLLLPIVFGRRRAVRPMALGHVLLQRSDVIGDVVMATPCIEWIKATSPGCRVSVLCRESTSDLLRGHPCLDDVIVDPTATGQRQGEGWRASAIGALVGRLRGRGIGAVISLWDRPSSLYPLAAWLARIPVRAGNLSFQGGWLLNAGMPRFEEGTLHEVEQNLRRVRAVGFGGEKYPHLSIALTEESVEKARLLFAQRNVSDEAFLVALSPATSGTNRRLEPEVYGDFVARIRRSHGATTLLLGGPADRDLTRAILARAPAGTVDLAGATSIGVLAAVIARCRVHVGGDSGPAHIAAALRVPGVVISPARSQKPLRWGPWMAPHRIVRKNPRCALRCFPGACRENFCVSAIGVDDLCQAFEKVAAGDGLLEPLGGRRSWAALSIAVIIHSPDDSRTEEAMTALRLLRCAGFIETVAACRPGSVLEKQARTERFDTVDAHTAGLFETIVAFGGGVVLDFGGVEKGSLRKAMRRARRLGVAAKRVAADRLPEDAAALTDVILAAVEGSDPCKVRG